MQFAVLPGTLNNVILQNTILGSKNKPETWQIKKAKEWYNKSLYLHIAGSILADINSSWKIIIGICSGWLQVNESGVSQNFQLQKF